MEEVPAVSIYIVTHLDSSNRGKVLKATCESALAQDYPNFEVVVSDNAGATHASEVLKSIDDPRLKIFRNKENVGMVPNMNLCLERCSNDIIKVNCDDDLLHPDCLRFSAPYVDDETYVLVGMEKYDVGTVPEGIKKRVSSHPRVEVRNPGYGPGNDLWQFTYDGLPGCTLFTRRFFQEMNCLDLDAMVDDWDLLIRSRLLKNVCFVDHVLCFQGVWPGSLTEAMLDREPYFFQQAGLYTKFKILAHPSLTALNRLDVRCMLLREFIKDSLRWLRHLNKEPYRSGYLQYCRMLTRKGRRFPAAEEEQA